MLDGCLVADSPLGRWLTEHGSRIAPGLRFAVGAFGLGVSCDQSLAAGEQIISCPYELAVTPTLARKQLGERVPRDSSDHVVMCAYLALHKTEKGFHSVYVDTLPEEDDLRTPLWFTGAEFARLQRTNVHGATLQRHKDWRDEYEKLDLGISWKDYLWAATILSSRAFPSRLIDGKEPATPVLFPGVDVINHRRGERVAWITGEQDLSIVTDVDLQPDVEIFNSYGPKSNDEFLLGYGFAVKDNPDDVAVLRLPGSTQFHMVKRDGAVPDELLVELKSMLGDDAEDLEVLDQLSEMLQAKIAALQAPVEEVEGPIRDDVRQAIEWYREGA